MNVVLVGGTGFIGRAVCAALVTRGDAVAAFVRDTARAAHTLPEGVALEAWEPSEPGPLVRAVAEADAAVNLAGESLAARRWTPEVKARLVSTRVETTRAMAAAIGEARNARCMLLNASAVGYYGDCGEREVDETAASGSDFLADLCVQWEAATRPAVDAGARVVLLRSGIVLGEGGGALEALAKPFRLMAGGPLGNGRQWVSWIHLADAVRLILRALDSVAISGPLNVTTPGPVRNRKLAHELGHAMRRPAIAPAPAFALRLILGEFAETVLGGQRVRPAAAEHLGFEWLYPTLREALEQIFGIGTTDDAESGGL